MYPTGAGRGAYLRRLEERITAVPGVESVTLTGGLPPNTSFFFGIALEAAGEPPKPHDAGAMLPFTEAGADFFDVTGARLLAGRPFRPTEGSSSGNVIVDADLADHLWPDGRAVGRRFRLDADGDWLTGCRRHGRSAADGPR
jgi:hypothetical protein